MENKGKWSENEPRTNLNEPERSRRAKRGLTASNPLSINNMAESIRRYEKRGNSAQLSGLRTGQVLYNRRLVRTSL